MSPAGETEKVTPSCSLMVLAVGGEASVGPTSAPATVVVDVEVVDAVNGVQPAGACPDGEFTAADIGVSGEELLVRLSLVLDLQQAVVPRVTFTSV